MIGNVPANCNGRVVHPEAASANTIEAGDEPPENLVPTISGQNQSAISN